MSELGSFEEKNIVVLTDEKGTCEDLLPTRRNIVRSTLASMVQGYMY